MEIKEKERILFEKWKTKQGHLFFISDGVSMNVISGMLISFSLKDLGEREEIRVRTKKICWEGF